MLLVGIGLVSIIALLTAGSASPAPLMKGLGSSASAAEPRELVDRNGTVQVPSFDIPLSRYMSREARKAFIEAHTIRRRLGARNGLPPIADVRKADDKARLPALARMRILYPVIITDRSIANVHTRVVMPKNGVSPNNRHRVLLNLHGGGFFMGENAEAMLESVPVSATAAIKVITVDYRQGPEYRYPAATDDVVAVYRRLLKEYRPTNIGIYGCSAGGILTAEVTAALQKEGLPAPGAIGIFSSGAYGEWYGDPQARGTWGGDSRYWANRLLGHPGISVVYSKVAMPPYTRAYFRGINTTDPQVSPAESLRVLSLFPPTLLLTGTRSYDMSAAVQTHRELIKSGAQAELHVWDGMWHCFFFDPDLPESKEAYSVIAQFFGRHLHK